MAYLAGRLHSPRHSATSEPLEYFREMGRQENTHYALDPAAVCPRPLFNGLEPRLFTVNHLNGGLSIFLLFLPFP